MPPIHSQTPGASGKRRHTVRIIKRRRPPRAAILSLLVSASTAAVLFAGWRMWRDDQPVVIPSREVSDVVLTWKCKHGHSISARGRAGTRPCHSCDSPMYPVTVYECDAHGQVEVMVQFIEDASGGFRIAKRRVARGRWVEQESDLRCPRCGRPLTRRKADDLTALGEAAGKGAG